MDLKLETGERRFRARLRAWLADVEPPPGLRNYGATPAPEDIDAARSWQRMLFEAGWAGISWPQEHGGIGASVAERAIYAEEMARAELPPQLNLVGLELVGPMIIEFGSDRQRERFLPPLLRGGEVWCQLFSEPGAGSDLAGLSTRAVPSGDGWVVTGQKTWTSGALYADMGLLLARTDPDSERHAGLSCFLLPMSRSGIEVRPIVQMDQEAKFNDVFLDGVAVTEDDLLGGVGQGWPVAVTTLGRERLTLGSQAVGLLKSLTQLRELAARNDRAGAVFRERWVRLWAEVHLLRWTWMRYLSKGAHESDPRMSLLKVVSSEALQELAHLGTEVAGTTVATAEGSEWRERLLASPGATIAGGTSEIQRNIIARRVLDLPRRGSRR